MVQQPVPDQPRVQTVADLYWRLTDSLEDFQMYMEVKAIEAERDRYLLCLQKIENRLSGHAHSTDLHVIGRWVREALGDKA